jgi:hypothetical protein
VLEVPVTVKEPLPPLIPEAFSEIVGLAGYEFRVLGDAVQLPLPPATRQERDTTPVNPSWVATLMGPLALPPDFTFGNAELAVRTKSGFATTFRVKVCVFAAGAPLLVADMVTVDRAIGDDAGALTVSPMATGTVAVGFTALEGAKEQLAPAGNPEHARFTDPLKDPRPVAWKLKVDDVVPRGTLTLEGFGAVKPKSTTRRVSGASCVVACASLPDP